VTSDLPADFARRVVDWQAQHGRHDLPWQRTRDPYAIWVSEIMLQQTQVATVIPYYERFMARFPSVAALASASIDDVMHAWSGLGYYSRARNLHKAANVVVEVHRSRFPESTDALATLPGIGRSTAAAIAALAYGVRCAILDGNVKRVLCRCFAIEGDPATSGVERRLWTLAEALAPPEDIAAYTQGMMDIGATVCMRARPRCDECPLRSVCIAHRVGRVDELPQARKRKPVPERRVAMLVLCQGANVLLEKRPQSGIWGGLWSLPEADVDDDLRAYCSRRFGVSDISLSELPEHTHGFTHFRLRIRPWRVDVKCLSASASEPGIMWLPLDDARCAAIPVPVRRILESQR
jgi:A/G-specific adenine glycosylase